MPRLSTFHIRYIITIRLAESYNPSCCLYLEGVGEMKKILCLSDHQTLNLFSRNKKAVYLEFDNFGYSNERVV